MILSAFSVVVTEEEQQRTTLTAVAVVKPNIVNQITDEEKACSRAVTEATSESLVPTCTNETGKIVMETWSLQLSLILELVHSRRTHIR